MERRRLDDEVKKISNAITDMGNLVLTNYKDAMSALKTCDEELAAETRKKDKVVGSYNLNITQSIMDLIATQSPRARDLRRAVGMMRVVNELERIGDYAKNISKYVRDHLIEHTDIIYEKIEKMYLVLAEMLQKVLIARDEVNVELAYEIAKMDDQLDQLYTKIIKKVFSLDVNDEEKVTLVLITKQLERAGDHITNICEEIIFVASGERIEF